MTFTAMVAKCNCGGRALRLTNHSKGRWVKYSLSCASCGVNSGLKNTLSDCVETWNVAMGPTALEIETSWTIEAHWKVGNLSTVRCMVD